MVVLLGTELAEVCPAVAAPRRMCSYDTPERCTKTVNRSVRAVDDSQQLGSVSELVPPNVLPFS